MTRPRLVGPNDADTLARIRAAFSGAVDGKSAFLEVRDDTSCDAWIRLGAVTLHVPPPDDEAGTEDPALDAIVNGYFEWRLPGYTELAEMLRSALADTESEKLQDDDLERILDHFAYVIVRVGLAHPIFDPDVIAGLPPRAPITIVADTSSVAQGALDFVARHLHPIARLKVPAVTHMELLTHVNNYFTTRRKSSGSLAPRKRARALRSRALGLGGQRAVLRLELHTDAELERAGHPGDPLRGIVAKDPEFPEYETIHRSFADRLIFETACDQQRLLPPGHRIAILTADEGLARMALAEGVLCWFYRSPKLDSYAGTTLVGTHFSPLSGELLTVPLPRLLWELAMTYGHARLVPDSGVEVDACEFVTTGPDLPWQPLYARDDLIWLMGRPTATTPPPRADAPTPATPAPPRQQGGARAQSSSSPSPSYVVSPPRLLTLMSALAAKREMKLAQAMQAMEVTSESTFRQYKNFLAAGGLSRATRTTIEVTDEFDSVYEALVRRDISALATALRAIPSFSEFETTLAAARVITKASKLSVRPKARASYAQLAELAGLALSIPGVGIVCTDAMPSAQEFAAMAVAAYDAARRGDRYALTGAWLECLAKDHGIHPVVARRRLEEARTAGVLDRFVEGSTPERRFDDHVLQVLETKDRVPIVAQVFLYHGDFLIPGQAGVSIRVEERPR